MIRPVRVSPPAAVELEAATRWYEQQRPGLGRHFLSAVQDALERIGRLPKAGSSIPVDSEARRALVRGFPYAIVYRVGREAIEIVAFAHAKRRPGFWRDRR